jgi:hypothetical protein
MTEEFKIGTHEAQLEFDRKRNYIYNNCLPGESMETIQQRETKAILSMGEAIKALSQQLNDANNALRRANERVAQLEAQIYGGPTK